MKLVKQHITKNNEKQKYRTKANATKKKKKANRKCVLKIKKERKENKLEM